MRITNPTFKKQYLSGALGAAYQFVPVTGWMVRSAKSGINYGTWDAATPDEAIAMAAKSAGLTTPFAANLYAMGDEATEDRAVRYVEALSGGPNRWAGG